MNRGGHADGVVSGGNPIRIAELTNIGLSAASRMFLGALTTAVGLLRERLATGGDVSVLRRGCRVQGDGAAGVGPFGGQGS